MDREVNAEIVNLWIALSRDLSIAFGHVPELGMIDLALSPNTAEPRILDAFRARLFSVSEIPSITALASDQANRSV
jgi:hypothetical protein